MTFKFDHSQIKTLRSGFTVTVWEDMQSLPFKMPPGEDKWMVRYGTPPYEFGAPTIEMRIHLSEFGRIREQSEDGIMIIHENLGSMDADYAAPSDATNNSPATWAPGAKRLLNC